MANLPDHQEDRSAVQVDALRVGLRARGPRGPCGARVEPLHPDAAGGWEVDRLVLIRRSAVVRWGVL